MKTKAAHDVRCRQYAIFAVAGLALLECVACRPRTDSPGKEGASKATNGQRTSEDSSHWNKVADGELEMLVATGDLAHLARASEAVQRSIQLVPADRNRGGLAMRVRVAMASHRFEEAKTSAEQLRALLPESTYPLQGLGDALFQLGDYAEAERVWGEIVAKDGSGAATEARLAQLDLIRGDVGQARQRLRHALELAQSGGPSLAGAVPSCHVRLGEVAFRLGEWEEAESHYAAALALEPDDYGALEHVAELCGAREKTSEAATLYTRLIERTHRPELMQALGDLYVFSRDEGQARMWHDRAEAAYRASVERGELGYYHHLAGFYCDSRSDPEKAVDCARRDLALRHSIGAYDALAWALCKAGRLDEASDAMSKALATGTRDAHILYHAGMIRMSAGKLAEGGEVLRKAIESNPRYNSFHVHR